MKIEKSIFHLITFYVISRTLPPEDIIAAHRKVAFSDPLNIFNVVEPFRPVIDDEFTEQPLTYFRSGKWQHEKEVIIGTTTQEVAKLHNSITNMNFKLFQVACDF